LFSTQTVCLATVSPPTDDSKAAELFKRAADAGDAAPRNVLRALAFCEKEKLTIDVDVSDIPPEAEPGEPWALIHLRLAPALKTLAETKAREASVSLNVFVQKSSLTSIQ
jgi:hypothetical protein